MQDQSIQQETPFVYTDYWAIFNEQMKTIQSAEFYNAQIIGSPPAYIKEYRTIGFRGIRQSGKTRWVTEAMKRFPDAIAIVSTPERRKTMQQDLGESDAARVFTPGTIRNMYRETGITQAEFPEVIRRATHVIVDEADCVYSRVRGFGLREITYIYGIHAFGHPPIVVEVN